MTIHLHSEQLRGVLKDNINTPKEEVVSSILPSVIFEETPSDPVDRLAELKRNSVTNFSLNRKLNGFSCLAEFNYYSRPGG